MLTYNRVERTGDKFRLERMPSSGHKHRKQLSWRNKSHTGEPEREEQMINHEGKDDESKLKGQLIDELA